MRPGPRGPAAIETSSAPAEAVEVRPAGERFLGITPARSLWIAPGRIGFMSTQRREGRWRLARCMDRAAASGHRASACYARDFHAFAGGRTARPRIAARFHPSGKSLSPGTPEWFHPSDGSPSPGTPDGMATNSLQSDCRTLELVRLIGCGSPPVRDGRRADAVTQAFLRSSFPPIPRLPVLRVSIRPVRGYR